MNSTSRVLRLLVCLVLTICANAAGVFIPAASRADVVHDAKRNIVYISNGPQLLRYDLESQGPLPPLELGGALRGMDLSPDGNTLAVANADASGAQVWFHLVDLATSTARKVSFPKSFGEGGLHTVAFGADGAVLISGFYAGSGWTNCRRYDPATGESTAIATLSDNSMLCASGDRTVIGISQGNISSGPVDRYDVALRAITKSTGNGWFNYEIGVNRDGTQFAVPTYGGCFIYDENLNLLKTLGTYAGPQPVGVAYHPSAQAVFFAWAGTSTVKVFGTQGFQEIGTIECGSTFAHPGNWAFTNGRLRLSADGSLLFVTVDGGVRVIPHGLNIPEFFRLEVAGSPAPIGEPQPTGYATNWLARGSAVTLSVPATAEFRGTRFESAGFSGNGSAPAAGTSPLNLELTNHTRVTWNWRAVAHQIEVSATTGGSVKDVSGWYPAGAGVKLEATPVEGRRFLRWVGDVPTAQSSANPLELSVDGPRRIKAVFVLQAASDAYLAGDWSTFGNGPAHRGYFPGAVGSAQFKRRWSTLPATVTHQVAVAEGRVYAVLGERFGRHRLMALSEASGVELWARDFPSGNSLNPPTYAAGNIYVQRGNAGDTHLWSLNAATGQTNWAAPHGAQWESYMAPTVFDGRIYVNGGTYGGMYGFTGEGQQLFFQGLAQVDQWTPTVSEGRLFSYTGGQFREHHLVSGTALWTLSVGAGTSTIVADDGVAFVNNGSGLAAVDLTRRLVAWEAPGTSSAFPAVADGFVYAISNNVVRALNTLDGQPALEFAATEPLSTWGHQPIATDDALIVAGDTRTFVFDRFTAALKQTLPVGGLLSVANSVLYVVGTDGAAHAYSAADDVDLVLDGSPVPVGRPTPLPYGTNTLAAGTALVCSVPPNVETNGTRYDCLGWTGTGSVPAEGSTANVSFNLANRSTLTWRWQARQHFLKSFASGRGSLNTGAAWWPAGATVEITATPEPGYRLVKWLGDVPEDAAGLSVTVSMDRPRRITAIFAPERGLPLAGDWPTFGGGAAHTGYFPGLLGTEPLQLRWDAEVVKGNRVNPLAVARGRVFATPLVYFTETFVSAWGAFSGRPLWRTPLPTAFSINAPAYADGAVFVQRGNHASDSQLWSLDAHTGATNWAAPFQAQWERYLAPTIADGGVYVDGGSYGGLYGFDQATGAQRFFYNGLGQYDLWTPTYYDQRLFTVVGGVITEHDKLAGTSLWNLPVPPGVAPYSMNRTAAADEGRLFFCSDAGLYCVDLAGKSLVWQVDGPFSGTPAVASGILYAIQQTNVVAYTTAGEPLGTYRADQPLSLQPIVTDDALIVAADAVVFVFDLHTFSLRQVLPRGGAVSVADGQLFIAGADGHVYAYGPGEAATLRMASSGVEAGDPAPLTYGDNFVPKGTEVVVTVQSPWTNAPGTRYVLSRLDLAGAVAGTVTNTNQLAFLVTGDTTLTWTWRKEHQLTTGALVGGQLDKPEGWYEADRPLVLTATPAEYFYLDGWTGYGIANGSQFTVDLSEPRQVAPRFKPELVAGNVPKWWLAQYHLPVSEVGAQADSDSDGLSNAQEFAAGSRPDDPDSDDDGYSDPVEVARGSNPSDAQSVPLVRLTVKSEPAAVGNPEPYPFGTTFLPLGTPLSLSVEEAIDLGPAERLHLLGWSGTGSAPKTGSGHALTFKLQEDSEVTWRWQREYSVDIQISPGPPLPGGTVSPTNRWWVAGAIARLEAVPAEYFTFANWTSGGNELSLTNRLYLLVDMPWAIQANFIPAVVTNGVPQAWLARYGLAPTDDSALADSDADGLENWREFQAGTVPTNPDTDGDGYPDGVEVARGTDPQLATSVPLVNLTIMGSPSLIGAPQPLTYGTTPAPLWSRITNTVPLLVAGPAGTRYRCAGWLGSGDVPPSGGGNTVSFALTNDSVLTWRWNQEYALMQTYGVLTGLTAQTAPLPIPLSNEGAPTAAQFGSALALDGNLAVITAPNWERAAPVNNRVREGVARFFRFDGAAWQAEHTLTALDSTTFQFGRLAALSGDMAAFLSEASTGAEIQIYARNEAAASNSWNLASRVPLAGYAYRYPAALTLSPQRLFIGLPLSSSQDSVIGGSIRVLRRIGARFADESYVRAPVGSGGYFGAALGARDDVLIASAPLRSRPGSVTGGVTIWRRATNVISWQLESDIAPAIAGADADFGAALDIEGDLAVVGAPGDSTTGNPTGAVYVYRHQNQAWTFEARLQPPTGNDFSRFGESVALRGNHLLVGAPFARGAAAYSGAAYLYTRANGAWVLEQTLAPATAGALSNFGRAVALSSDRALVGAPALSGASETVGNAFLFDLSGALPPLGEPQFAWFAANALGGGATAPPTITISNRLHHFGGWMLDGVRVANAHGTAINPITGLIMDRPHAAQAIYLPDGADSDADTLPDYWEYAYFGSAGTAPEADPDGDGLSNAAEFAAGTHPTRNQAAEPPELRAELIADGGSPALRLSWVAGSGRSYRISHTADLAVPFEVIAKGIPGAPLPWTHFTNRVDASTSGFFRVEVE